MSDDGRGVRCHTRVAAVTGRLASQFRQFLDYNTHQNRTQHNRLFSPHLSHLTNTTPTHHTQQGKAGHDPPRGEERVSLPLYSCHVINDAFCPSFVHNILWMLEYHLNVRTVVHFTATTIYDQYSTTVQVVLFSEVLWFILCAWLGAPSRARRADINVVVWGIACPAYRT